MCNGVADITVVSNAAGDISSVLGKTLQYDAAGRLSQATAVPPCPSGNNCVGAQTTISRFNGWGQRYLRENEQEQSVFGYGPQGFELLTQTRRDLASSALRSTEHIWLPTASGPMPIAAVIDGVHYAVHADHLNTPRRLSDSSGQSRWQWPYSGFGEIASQSTPATGQASVNYSLRYPGQIDDGNELFYNWHRFYDPRLGRYVSSDPIGLEGGFNRFGYVGGNPLGKVDPEGLQSYMCAAGLPAWCPPPAKPVPQPSPPGFNEDPCVQNYLQQYYGSFVANTMVPNFSLLSYVPGSGTAGQAWTSTAISVGTKRVFVGAPYAFSVGVDAMSAAGAGVAGGSSSSALLAAGGYAGTFASFASGGLALFGAATLPFSSAANAMALAHCGCNK